MININVTLLIQLANILILMYLLNVILFKPVVRLLEERKERTEGRRKMATQLEGEAEGVWAEYQTRIQEARTDADKQRMDLVRQGESERQRVVDAAASQAEKTVSEVRARVRADAQEARKALEAQAKLLAASAAQKILGRTI